MILQSFDWYRFFVDIVIPIVIPIGTFVVGLVVEKKWHITKIFIKDQSVTNQTQSTDGENNSPVQIRDNFGVIIAEGGISSSTPEALPYKEEAFVKTIVNVLQNKNVESSFAEHYQDGYKHLKNNCASLSASAYLSAYFPIKTIFLEISNYRDDVNKDLVATLESGFVNLKYFSDKPENDNEKLSKITSGIENALGSLFGYLK